MSSSALRYIAAVIVLFIAAGYAVTRLDRAAPRPSGPPPVPSISEVVSATKDAPIARVRLRVNAHMPPQLDDGVPDREFTGRGVVHQGREIAGVYFDVADVPNTAGYFGHVDERDLTAIYVGSRFIISFPVLADVLPGRVDWMSYELASFSHPKMLRLGIGQLREIALSDPRFAVALLGGATGGLRSVQPTPGTESVGRPFSTVADIAAAASATPEMGPVFEEMLALGVSKVDIAVDVDGEDRVGRVTYSLRYPPGRGSRPVRLSVEMTFVYGVRPGLGAPPPRSVVEIEDHLSL